MGKGKGKKKKLTGLAAALVKSGHLDEKKARKLSRDKRREDKALGREGVAEREAAKQVAADVRKAAEADAARERERGRKADEDRMRVLRAIREGIDPNFRGSRQWFFIARDGRVLFLKVSDSTARMLGDGQAGIVESQGVAKGEHVVLGDPRALTTLIGIDKELVRFWNRDAGSN